MSSWNGGCRDDAELAARERERLEADHNDVTVAIFDSCGIPRSLAEPVFYHEAPESSSFSDGSRPHQLAHLFYHAKRVADMGLAPEGERSGIIAELMLLGGKLGDRWGAKRAFTVGLLVYGLGSLTTALSPTLGVLLVGWSFIEGFGAVLVIPAIAALTAATYSGRQRALAYGILGGVSGASLTNGG